MLLLEKARGLSAAAREGESGWNQKPVEGGKKMKERGDQKSNTGKIPFIFLVVQTTGPTTFLCVSSQRC